MLDPAIHDIVKIAHEALAISIRTASAINAYRRSMKEQNPSACFHARKNFEELTTQYEVAFLRTLSEYKRDTHHCHESYIAVQVATSAFLNRLRVSLERLGMIDNGRHDHGKDACLQRIGELLKIVERDFPAAGHFIRPSRVAARPESMAGSRSFRPRPGWMNLARISAG
jgi:hypothetical protein